jgi:hypothetical protein
MGRNSVTVQTAKEKFALTFILIKTSLHFSKMPISYSGIFLSNQRIRAHLFVCKINYKVVKIGGQN